MTGRTRILGRSAFLTLGCTGFWVAVALVLALSAATGLSVAVQAAISAAAVAVYCGVAWAAQRILGRAVLVYYHHVLAFLMLAAALAAILGAPVLAHLDVTACGLAAFTALARTGCLLVGCCHGRPARWGVRYGEQHVRHGLPAYLVGQRLLPVQAAEAGAAALLAVAGSVAVLGGAAPGTAFVLFVCGYATVRFALEWLRGDLRRPYARRLSEAQWISLALGMAAAAAAAAGVLPGGAWPALAALALVSAAAVTLAGRAPGAGTLLAPPHVRELAARLDRLALASPEAVRTARTTQGLRVSIGQTGGTLHYTVSSDRLALDEQESLRVARLLLWMRHPRAAGRIVPGQAGAVHLLID